MNVVLCNVDFKKLFPHITHFEFEVSLAKKGLKYVRMLRPNENHYNLNGSYLFKVIDEPLFMMHAIKNEISPIMVEDVDQQKPVCHTPHMTTNDSMIKKFIQRVERAFPLDLDNPTNEDVDYKLCEIMSEIRAEAEEEKKMNEYFARDWQEVQYH